MNSLPPGFRFSFSVRVIAFALVLAFGGLQTVAFTDCCCTEVCARQHGRTDKACESPDAAEKASKPPQGESGCCGSSKPVDTSCVHVQPSSDVVSHALLVEVVPPAGFIQPLTLDLLNPFEAGFTERPAAPARPARGRPLFLLFSALLI